MIIGFTGTRQAMSERQRLALQFILAGLRHAFDHDFHHGDCIGADATAAKQAILYGWKVIAHPSDLGPQFHARTDRHVSMPEKPPLERNHDIVDVCDLLVAAPRWVEEEQRSGTWATIRYARKVGKPVIILEP